jgi:hypothetical protein
MVSISSSDDGGNSKRFGSPTESFLQHICISGVHALHLARGGPDFLIRDGALNYAPEYLWETY